MSCRGVTLQTRAASAADSRRRWMTSPSFAMRVCARMSCASRPSRSATVLPFPTSDRPVDPRSWEATSVLAAAERVKNEDRWLIPDHDVDRLARRLLLRLALRRSERLAVRDLHVHV